MGDEGTPIDDIDDDNDDSDIECGDDEAPSLST